jgi:hypothetical protein
MRTWPLAVLLPFLGLGAPSACSSSPAVSVHRVAPGSGHERIEGDPVRLRRAPREVYEGIRSGFYVVRSEDDWREAWPGGKAAKMPRTIDTSTTMLLVAVARRPDTVRMSVEGAVENSSGIHVLVRETKNGEGCILPKARGLAYDAVLSARIEKPVRFYVEEDRAESCGDAPEVTVKCRINDGLEWAEGVTAQPGDRIECDLSATARGAFALTDRVLGVGGLPKGSGAKLTYLKGPTRGTFSIDLYGTYTIRGEALDESGRKAEAVATIEALPPKTRDAVVQQVWTGFEANDDPETFPRVRLVATVPSEPSDAPPKATPPKAAPPKAAAPKAAPPKATPPKECSVEQPLADFCEVKTRGAYSDMTVKASEAKVPLSVRYLDERAEGGPAACVQVFFDGARTVEACDRAPRAADETWNLGVLDMTTGKLVDAATSPDAGAPDAAAPDAGVVTRADAGVVTGADAGAVTRADAGTASKPKK